MKNGDAVVLLHIRDALQRAVEYGAIGEDAFKKDTRTQDAILRCLEVVGEATKRLSAALRDAHPHVPWKRIAGFRDIAIHHYDRVDLNVVWDLVEDDVPKLLADVRGILAELGERR